MYLKKFFIMIVCMILVTSFAACWNPKKKESYENLTEKEKLEDFQYLYNVIKENYPFLEVNKKVHDVDWLDNKKDYIDTIKNAKTDEMFFNALNDILKKLNNEDTHMIKEKDINKLINMDTNNKAFKYNKKVLTDSNVKKRYSKFIESKPNYITDNNNANNVIAKDIVADKIAYLSINSMLSTDSEFMNNDIKVIDNYLEKIKDYNSLVIDIRGNAGGDNNYWEHYLVPRIMTNPLIFETYNFFKDGDLINDFFEFNNIELKNLPKVKSLSKEDLPKAPSYIFKDFKYYTKNTVKIEPRNSINFGGRIYLLTDKNVLNEADTFSIFAKQTSFATIIGENTGGKGIGKDPISVVLPNSGFLFTFPKELGTEKDGTCNIEQTTYPNFEVKDPSKTKDFADDLCIQKVLELEGLNVESTVSITNKEFNFIDTLPDLLEYDKEKHNELYTLISRLLNDYNGEITNFGDTDNIAYKFKKQHNGNNSITINYKTPKKISIQSKSKSIPIEYRDKFHNVTLEVTEINISWIPEENVVLINLNGRKKGIVIEFFDNIITSEFVKLTT